MSALGSATNGVEDFGKSFSNAMASSPYTVDKTQLSEFMQSQAGSKYADVYKPEDSYANWGGGVFGSNMTDVTSMMKEYQNWLSSNNVTKQNWDNYSKAVSANEGGEGDNAITQGAAVSQRSQLLGALANAGNPTTATPGIGRMGAAFNMGQQKPGVPIK